MGGDQSVLEMRRECARTEREVDDVGDGKEQSREA